MSENNNFDELKRLLKLKQHEVPPPGYFHNFSSEVMSRIRAGETADNERLVDQIRAQVPWLFDFLGFFQMRPVVIGGAATSLCLLLLMGVVLADRSDSLTADALTGPAPTAPNGASLATTLPAMAATTGGIAISTNPVISLQPVTTLFGQQQNPLFQSASFAAPIR